MKVLSLNNLISDSTLKTVINSLVVKDFFRKVYYSKWAFYSTKLTKEELEVAASKWLVEKRREQRKRLDNKSFRELAKSRSKSNR